MTSGTAVALLRASLLVTLVAAMWLGLPRFANATPFADVPADHWAYQYLQSLAADGVIEGYPDGTFDGNRPLTRYEMAAIVARAIARIQEEAPKLPSKADLDKLQKLIDALKDELDALGVRVSNLEDSVDALDRRTAFAQSLSLHGVFLPDVTVRERAIDESSVTNTTGAPVTTYYGATIPSGSAGAADPYLDAFLDTDDSNNPFSQAPPGIEIRQADRFALAYAVSDDLTVSLPVRILNFDYGGTYAQQSAVDIEPSVDVDIPHAGALSNLAFTFGIVDDMTSSRLGLAFQAPQGFGDGDPYAEPYQPYQKGIQIKGTVGEGAFGLTDVEASFTRVDNVLLDTQPNVTSPGVAPFQANQYLYPVVPPQETYTQTSPAGALRTDSFVAGANALAQVFLTQKAVDGSVYVASYDGTTYNSSGVPAGGTGSLPAPAFTYNDAYNSVVFAMPLPPGSRVSIAYKGLSVSDDAAYERYMVHVRANQTFKGYTGAEVGLTFNRIFDEDEGLATGGTATSLVDATATDGMSPISDTVFGLDFALPVPLSLLGPGSSPTFFGEFAGSQFNANTIDEAATGGAAGVVGINATVEKVALSLQYQDVGAGYFAGAPFGYYGNAPALFSSYKDAYFPEFFGFANDVGINEQFDRQFAGTGAPNPGAAGNPNLTYAYPVYDVLHTQSPTYFSAFAPNTRGETLTANVPIRLGPLSFATTGTYQHLSEIRPNAIGAALYGPSYASNVPETDDAYGLATKVAVPFFGSKAVVGLNGGVENLQRLDRTPHQYYPIDPSTGLAYASAVAAAAATFGTGGSGVSYYPNYVAMRHITIGTNIAVPLGRDLSLGASYTTQRYGGADGTTLSQNVSERKDYYSGSLTYSIPKTNSSLSFVERHYGYTDQVVQNLNLSQNTQDLNFAVRF